MDENVELKLIGITYNQIESGVYALILEDVLMKRRLAIVIGYPEAQSIECKLQNVKTPRPLAHDLLASLLQELGAELLRVDIQKLSTGPYAGKLTVQDSLGQIKVIDARSSDAIALAIRVGAPIFTSRKLLEKEGYTPKVKKETNKRRETTASSTPGNSYSKYDMQKLHEMLQTYVAEENYEAAAEIKKEIELRKGKMDSDKL